MKLKSFFLALTTLVVINANAQHDHGSHGGDEKEHTHKVTPPHGGELHDVGKYHLEIIFDKLYSKEQFKIYLLKSNMKTLTLEGSSAQIKLSYKNGTQASYDFKNQGEFMVATVKDVINGFDAIISITYENKSYTTSYHFKGL